MEGSTLEVDGSVKQKLTKQQQQIMKLVEQNYMDSDVAIICK